MCRARFICPLNLVIWADISRQGEDFIRLGLTRLDVYLGEGEASMDPCHDTSVRYLGSKAHEVCVEAHDKSVT